MIYLSISSILKICMGIWLTKVIILWMALLRWWVAAIMALAVLGSIFLYKLSWNAASSSSLDNCPYRLLWKSHTILDNQLYASYLYSALTVSLDHCRSILEMAWPYSCLGADQTVAIWIKSRERLMLIPHALQTSSHHEYAVLVQNTWLIRCLK